MKKPVGFGFQEVFSLLNLNGHYHRQASQNKGPRGIIRGDSTLLVQGQVVNHFNLEKRLNVWVCQERAMTQLIRILSGSSLACLLLFQQSHYSGFKIISAFSVSWAMILYVQKTNISLPKVWRGVFLF